MRRAGIVPGLVVTDTMDFRPSTRGAWLAVDHRALSRAWSPARVAVLRLVIVAAVLGTAHAIGKRPLGAGAGESACVGTGCGTAQRRVLGNRGTNADQGRIHGYVAACVGSRPAAPAAARTAAVRARGPGRTAATFARRAGRSGRARRPGRASHTRRAARHHASDARRAARRHACRTRHATCAGRTTNASPGHGSVHACVAPAGATA